MSDKDARPWLITSEKKKKKGENNRSRNYGSNDKKRSDNDPQHYPKQRMYIWITRYEVEQPMLTLFDVLLLMRIEGPVSSEVSPLSPGESLFIKC